MENIKNKLAGLVYYRQKETIRDILGSGEIKTTFNELIEKKNQPLALSRKKTRQILSELTSDFSPKLLRMSYWCIRLIETFMFKKIKSLPTEFDEIRKLTTDGKIIFFLPNHKSHMDYLLISYILYTQGIAPPHIAAGDNLSFFPVGSFFRKTGAYFIRRKIAGNFLYTKTLQAYFDWMLRKKISQEFYMEGGRSRDGKIRKAQSGIFLLFLEQIRSLKLESEVYIVPTGITYERVPEIRSLLQELQGAKKEKESMFALLGAVSILFTNHHNVHISMGQPIQLSKLVGSDFTKKSFPELSQKIISEIERQKTVTVSSLIASAILSSEQKISKNEVRTHITNLIEQLKPCKTCISEDALNMLSDLDKILSRYERWGWFVEQGDFLIPNQDKLHEMSYYFNDLQPKLIKR